MKNIWVQANDIHRVQTRMDEEDAMLRPHLNDPTQFRRRVRCIAEAAVEEFWQPESFDEGIREFMLSWREELTDELTDMVTDRVLKTSRWFKDNLFELTMRYVLHYLSVFHDDIKTQAPPA